MSFKELFTAGHPEKAIALVEEILNPDGGFLFDGHKLDAPADYRKPLGWGNRCPTILESKLRQCRKPTTIGSLPNLISLDNLAKVIQ